MYGKEWLSNHWSKGKKEYSPHLCLPLFFWLSDFKDKCPILETFLFACTWITLRLLPFLRWLLLCTCHLVIEVSAWQEFALFVIDCILSRAVEHRTRLWEVSHCLVLCRTPVFVYWCSEFAQLMISKDAPQVVCKPFSHPYHPLISEFWVIHTVKFSWHLDRTSKHHSTGRMRYLKMARKATADRATFQLSRQKSIIFVAKESKFPAF